MDHHRLEIRFDPNPSRVYPHGYWYASAAGDYDAVGTTLENALATLVIELSKALEKKANDSNIQKDG